MIGSSDDHLADPEPEGLSRPWIVLIGTGAAVASALIGYALWRRRTV